jgi:hypothetical protein
MSEMLHHIKQGINSGMENKNYGFTSCAERKTAN